MDALLLVRRVERGMVTAAGAAGIGEDEDPLAARLKRRRLGLACARGPAFKFLPAVARRDQALGAAGDFRDRIVTEMFEQGIERRHDRRHRAEFFDQFGPRRLRSEEQTSELQSLMRNSYAVFCFIK